MATYIVKSGTHYRKIGGKSKFTRFVKGDTFQAEPHEVENFKDCLQRVGPPVEPEPEAPPTADQLEIVHKGFGKYIVINNSYIRYTIEGAFVIKPSQVEKNVANGGEKHE